MYRRLAVVVALIVAAIAATAGTITAPATAGSSTPGWLIRCPYTHTALDDPIVHPGMTGMSHPHDFFGNRSAKATSTYRSMTSATTSCGTAADKAGYWIPALYRNGKKIATTGSWNGVKVRQQIYYRDNNVRPGTRIQPFPADLRLVAGNGHARSVAENPKLGREIYWGCSDNSQSGKPVAPVSCATGIITLHIGFPNCWNGVLTHRNDTAHVVYPKSGVCPAKNPIVLPRLIERFEYAVGRNSSGITLASGRTFTVHADFWNTWHQPGLNRLVSRCLNGDVSCGTNPVA